MGRILALDHGEKRIGVAISDPLGYTAQALPYLTNRLGVFKEIQTLIETHSVSLVLMGLPLDQSGNEGKKAQEVRSFSEKLAHAISVSITFCDERYSTVAAEKQLLEMDMNRKKRKQRIDSQAACFVLQGYLDSNHSS